MKGTLLRSYCRGAGLSGSGAVWSYQVDVSERNPLFFHLVVS